MNITYRTRRRLQRLGILALVLLIVLVLGWLCCVVWLERYVIYTRDGAVIDFEVEKLSPGVVASPPSNESSIEIYYNEGSNAVDNSTELTQLTGYYIDKATLVSDLAGTKDKLSSLASGTAIMIDLKNTDGTFNYSSELADATMSTSVDVAAVDDFISDLNSGKFYTIARISAFRDYYYFINDNSHVMYGLSHSGWGTGYLYKDDGSYWFDPTSSGALNWIISIIQELKEMGFNEVVLDDFQFPNTDKIIFSGDKTEALTTAMTTILDSCASDSFAVSFTVTSASFALPEGRCRLYLENVSADQVGLKASQATMTDPIIRLVFVATTNDTRFNDYSVLRPISSSEVLEGMD